MHERNDRAKEDTFVADHLFMRASVNSSVATINPKRISKEEPREKGGSARLSASSSKLASKARGKCATFLPELRRRASPGNHEGSALLGFSHTDIVDIFEKLASPTFTGLPP